MSEFEQWYVDQIWGNESFEDGLRLSWQAAKQSMQGESIPAGFALVPIKETKAIRLVVEQEDWEWRDVLAAAGSITEDEFNSPDYVETIADLQAENEALHAKLSNIVEVSETLCSLIDDITISNQTNSIKAQELYRWKDKLDSIVIQYNSDAAIKGGE